MASKIRKGERNALIGLSRREDLVVKPFDKGRGMCSVIVKDKGERQLSRPHCEELREDLTWETLERNARVSQPQQSPYKTTSLMMPLTIYLLKMQQVEHGLCDDRLIINRC